MSTRLRVLILLLCSPVSTATFAAISFTDETAVLGDVNNVSYESWGAAWGDLNTDGFPDLYTGNHRNYGQMLVNQLDGTFQQNNGADAEGMWSSGFAHYDDHGSTWADMDNDGDLDLLLSEAVRSNRWLRNDNGTLFRGFETGVQTGYMPINLETGTQTNNFFEFRQNCNGNNGAWGVLTDLNHSGRLELICVNNGEDFPSEVRVADGGPQPTLPVLRPVIDLATGDFDGDLRNDYVLIRGRDRPNGATLLNANTVETQMNVTTAANNQELTIVTAGSLTLHNINDGAWRGNGTDFSSVRIGAGGYAPTTETFTLDVNDAANLGLPANSDTADNRLFVGYDTAEGAWKIRFNSAGSWEYIHFYATSDAPITSISQPSGSVGDQANHPRLYRNTPTGFVDAGFGIGLDQVQCVSVVSGDFDNDMDLDLYMACRDGASNIANELFENDGTGNFTRQIGHGAEGIIGGAVFDNAGNADSVVTADYNLDGMLDLFVINGLNMRPRWVGGPKQLFANTPNGNNYVMFDLEGTLSNRDGIGAKLWITTPDGTVQYREQNGGYHRWSQNHMRVHVGLAANASVDVEVLWPSGQVDTYQNLNANEIYRLVEAGAAEPGLPDSDGDGTIDPLDADDDNDGVLDVNDAFPLDPAETTDSDGDGVGDNGDAFPNDPTEQLDTDLDLIGNNADNDDDGDGIPDTVEDTLSSVSFTLTTSELRNSEADGLSQDFQIALPAGFEIGATVTVDNVLADGDLDTDLEVFTLNINNGELNSGAVQTNLQCQIDLIPLTTPVSGSVTVVDIGAGQPGLEVNLTRATEVNGLTACVNNLPLRVAFDVTGDLAADTDGDGLLDRVDLDSDNDAIPDVVEAGLTDSDNDALADTQAEQGSVASPPDSDADGIADYLDIESSNPANDGTAYDIAGTAAAALDSNSDGQLSTADNGGGVDADGDGLDDLIDTNPAGHGSGEPEVTLFCGEPTISNTADRATFLWRDCGATETWSLRVTGGSTPSRLDYIGQIEVAGGLSSLTGVSIEAADDLDQSDPNSLAYQLVIFGNGVDGFDFTVPTGACFTPQLPDTLPVYLGATRTELMTDDVDLETGLACPTQPDADGDGLSDAEEAVLGTDPNNPDTDGGSVSDGDEVNNGTDPLDGTDDIDPAGDACGEPTFSGSTDRALFLWKDCSFAGPAARWNVRATAGGGAFDSFSGQLDSDAVLAPVGFSLEGADVLDSVPGDGLVDYTLTVGNAGIDGFQVDVPAGANTCFDPASLANGADARLGGNQLPITGPIQLQDLAPCSVDPTCNEPDYDPATEPGIYLWRNCAAAGADASWSVRIVAGGLSWTEFAGSLTLDTVANATSFSLEPADTLDSTPGDGFVDFSLFVSNNGVDGFDLVIPDGALSCFDPTTVPAGAGVFVGSGKQTPAGPFNLEDLGVCP